jgi:hypothetical protein
MNDDMAKSFTARFHEVCKGFSDEYQIYQHIVKNGEAEIPVSEYAEMSDLLSPDILGREEAYLQAWTKPAAWALPDKVSHHYVQIFADLCRCNKSPWSVQFRAVSEPAFDRRSVCL